MTAPSRAGAAPRVPVVIRRRLIDLLARRFEVRLTVVVGGGGSGKTTALSQAMADETEHIDVWYPSTPADRDDNRFFDVLLSACAATLGQPDLVDVDRFSRLCDLVLEAAPQRVCLVIDDAHLLPGGAAIERLLRGLPANGHVLVAGRRAPPINTARLDAAGRLAEVGQDELLMTAEEQIDFANLRGVDVELLDGAEGWPAFVELASTGSESRSRRYLEQEAVAALSAERRAALAAFGVVGGGDDEIAEAVTGLGLDDLVAGLPLVRWSGDDAQLHDLWGELLIAELDTVARSEAALAAAGVRRRRGEFDRAIMLAASVEQWDDVIESLSAAVLEGVDGGLRSDQLHRWRTVLPPGLSDHPIVVLIDAIIERERDPTSVAAFSLFDRAARGFEDADDAALELVALAQLGYLARIGGDPTRIEPVMERMAVLTGRYPPAQPFLAFGEAWKALAIGRPDLQLAALERITDEELPAIWAISRDHLIAHALFNLGRPEEALARVPAEIDTLPIPIPGALVTESQCLWYAGQPEVALDARPAGLSARHGARDRFIAGAWVSLMRAYAGQVDEAREALRIAEQHVGENPSVMLSAQLVAAQLLIKLADGDDATPATELAAILEVLPLGGGVSEQFLRNHLAVPYLLVPATRDYWDHADLGPAHIRAREAVIALVHAREDGDAALLASMLWPEPGFLASNFPVRWAIEFALRGVRAGRHEGRMLAAWLCEHWGDPARAALRSWVDHNVLGDVARDLVARTPSPPLQRVEVRVLGQLDLLLEGHSTADPDWRRERVRGLLTWLVLNPTTTRDGAAGALWPDLPIERAAKNLRTTLNYLHRVLEPRRSGGDATWFVRVDGQQIRLHGGLDVDLWQFRRMLDDAERAERQGHPGDALPLLIRAVGLSSGDLAADLDHEWLDLERIHVRSRFVRACCRAAELLVATGRPSEAIEVVTPALASDPWHEAGYVVLANAYDALGDSSSARAIIRRAEDQLGELTTTAGRRRASEP